MDLERAWTSISAALIAGIEPPPATLPSQWAADNLILPDGPRAGELWSLALTPYIKEPLDLLGPNSPVNEIVVMKSAQTGFTAMLIAAIGHSIDHDPCRMMVVQPTDSALSEFNSDKLQPAIDRSGALKAKVETQKSRSGKGSTTYSKRFPGGSLTMSIASSSADLRSKTVKKLLRDEIDEYPDDLDGQGDPLELSRDRLMSFLAQGDWKIADISTPTIKGASKIEHRHLCGDQRRWNVRCPHCDGEFVFEFGPNFVFERQFPFGAHYVAPCCGSIITAEEKFALSRAGRWIATDSRPGAYPSYHFDALSSPFVPWDETAKRFVAAGDDQQKLKVFWNNTLGRPYEIKGDAPDHIRLLERREGGLVRGQIPPRGIILVAAADVQMRGIWVEVVAFAPNRESWVVDTAYLDGSTESVDGEAFALLKSRVLERDWAAADGATRRIDALGVDSGYRTHIVYAWVKANQIFHPDTGQDVVLALDGRDGWGRPAIGAPSLVDINLAGRKLRKGGKVWPVGTWPLKGAFYADLRKEGVQSGRERDPDGYCHFGDWLDSTYFRQITAEYLADAEFRGRPTKVWKLKASERDNHLLDCRIYCLALAEYLGLSSLTEAEWIALAKARGAAEGPRHSPSKLPDARHVGETPPRQPAAKPPPTDEEQIEAELDRLGRMNSELFR